MKPICITFLPLTILALCASCRPQTAVPKEVTFTTSEFSDRIRGAWAGQIIGCTYGGPTEFRHPTTINKDIDIPWHEHMVKQWFDNQPMLYDDIYMDLTFVDVFEKEGLDAPVESFATAFADAGYGLWHANQQARYNIHNGIMPPQSGYWENNPHADDIDFQIEADFAGIMCPGLPAAANGFCDRIGHIMNYGDGWYGGVFVANMYSMAFVSDDVEFVVSEALKAIPEQSRFHRCIADVIGWYHQYPEDWNLCWAKTHAGYGFDIGCPEGVLEPYDIDAVLNSAYIVIGLLYGQKNFFRTIDIACRCGADSDCNPSSAGGILGAMIGYEAIPDYWKQPLVEVADRNFMYTAISFNRACELSSKHACQIIEREGGSVCDGSIVIKTQLPQKVRYEECFTGHWPVQKRKIAKSIRECPEIEFEGNGIVVRYNTVIPKGFNRDSYTPVVEFVLDGELVSTEDMPLGRYHKLDLFYKYNLPVGKHTLSFRLLNPVDDVDLTVYQAIIYSDKPHMTQHEDK